ncbi:hypothetical protein RHMOL_Rhmol04G0209600 [Rhododendron molle]|uniref:Uncharacterized protein n=1 Tax=Rhododendron molle TaxID=49168 RepID=A0ACC0P3Y6_RHOML|nr:hypothetical protein RHMOL_Rhmol04G0209600 [Rhododendron molle]
MVACLKWELLELSFSRSWWFHVGGREAEEDDGWWEVGAPRAWFQSMGRRLRKMMAAKDQSWSLDLMIDSSGERSLHTLILFQVRPPFLALFSVVLRCSSFVVKLDSPSSVEVADPKWVAQGEFICVRLIGFSCINLHSPIIEDFALYSLVLQNKVFRDLFNSSASLYPRFSVTTLMSKGFINFSILNAEELTEEEEVSMRHSSSIRVSSDRVSQAVLNLPLLRPLHRGVPVGARSFLFRIFPLLSLMKNWPPLGLGIRFRRLSPLGNPPDLSEVILLLKTRRASTLGL